LVIKQATIRLPEKARIFHSCTCDCCGETAGANWNRQKLRLDCYEVYDRFNV
jgi:formylmethanofuran dehydrogenase subunit E